MFFPGLLAQLEKRGDPEVYEGMYDQKADMFSTGIILVQLLTGVHPLRVKGVDSVASVRQKILSTTAVKLPASLVDDRSSAKLHKSFRESMYMKLH